MKVQLTRKKLFLAMLGAFALCIIVALSVVGFGATQTAAASEFHADEVSTVEYFDNVNRSVAIFDEAMSAYRVGNTVQNGTEVTIYCDTFAGVFIDDNGFLNIGRVGQFASASSSGFVVYRQKAFSFNDLRNAQESVSLIMERYGIHAVSIDEANNQVSVKLNDESNISRIVSYLSNNFNEAKFNFVVESGIDKTANIAFGGANIGGGTLGVNARCNLTGQLGILTNEHVAPVGTVMHSDGRLVGTSLRGQFGGTIDVAFVPFADQSAWSPTPQARLSAAGSTLYTNIRTGNDGHIIQGRPVRRLGRTTGDTTGTIASRSVNTSAWGVAFTNQFTFTNFSDFGDSGGPVFWNDGANNSLHIIGLNWATNWTVGFGSRINEAMTILNVTPITNDSFQASNIGTNNISINRANFNFTGPFVIPETFNNRTVTQIGASAFANQTTLSQITIPATVVSIGANAFVQNIHVVLKEGRTQVQARLFQNQVQISKVTIAESVLTVEEYAFAGTRMSSVTFLGRTNIGTSAFGRHPGMRFFVMENVNHYRSILGEEVNIIDIAGLNLYRHEVNVTSHNAIYGSSPTRWATSTLAIWSVKSQEYTLIQIAENLRGMSLGVSGRLHFSTGSVPFNIFRLHFWNAGGCCCYDFWVVNYSAEGTMGYSFSINQSHIARYTITKIR